MLIWTWMIVSSIISSGQLYSWNFFWVREWDPRTRCLFPVLTRERHKTSLPTKWS